MTSKIANLVQQTTTGTGTGNLNLTAPTTGYKSFSSSFGTGSDTNVFYYFISHTNAVEWEVGTGHMSDATTLIRDTVIESSNSNSLVDFSSGTKNVVNDLPQSIQTLIENLGYSSISSTADWNTLLTDGSFITSGTTYINAPLFDLETTGILKVYRTSTSSTYINQEWLNQLTGNTWVRYTMNSGTTWSMWKAVQDYESTNGLQQSFKMNDMVIYSSTSSNNTIVQTNLLFKLTTAGLCSFPVGSASASVINNFITLGTLTNAAGNPYILPSNLQNGINFAGISPISGGLRFETVISIDANASDDTNTYTVIVGGQTRTTLNIRAFSYTHSENSGNWTLISDNAGTETTVNSGVAPSFGFSIGYVKSYQKLRIEMDFSNSKTMFYINDVLISTVTANYRATFYPVISIVKSVGTTARYVSIGETVLQYNEANS